MKDEYLTRIKMNCIVLLYTGHDRKYGTNEYYYKQPEILPELAEFLISQKTKLLGMDLPSPDPPPFKVHKLLLTNNIFIIENLTNLDKLLKAALFEVMAFPLKINADSSILRVVAKITI
jgi:kynurenine formamidase